MPLKFNEKQKFAWSYLTSDRTTRILFDGGSRSGKTALLTEYLVRRALQYPGSRQLAARKCRAHAKTSLWTDTIKTYLTKFIPSKWYTLSETELTVRFSNGAMIVVGGLDDAERTEKILGNEYITVFLNEATQLSWATVQMAATRLAQRVKDKFGHCAMPKLLLDCNPRGPRHWLHSVGVRHLDPESGEPLADAAKWMRINWSAYDNKENLPPEYLAALEALPKVMQDRMLNGIWCDNEGAVYQEFSEEGNVVDAFPIPPDWKRLRAIDFGYTNPFVCLWGAVDPDGRIYVYREWYKAQTRTREHAEKIRQLSAGENYLITVADHDAGDRAELEACGVRTIAAEKEVIRGIQAVKNRLVPAGDGKPRLFFFRNLKNILSEMYEYRWAPVPGGGNAKEEPLKLNDHAMDALRYMVMALDGKRAINGKFRSTSSGGSSERWR